MSFYAAWRDGIRRVNSAPAILVGVWLLTVLVSLPLTLAIIDGLLVRVGKGRYVIPLSAVEECVVAGIPDAYRGQTVKAFIKCRDNQSLTPDQRHAGMEPVFMKADKALREILTDDQKKKLDEMEAQMHGAPHLSPNENPSAPPQR